jgi:hypothetical protein
LSSLSSALGEAGDAPTVVPVGGQRACYAARNETTATATAGATTAHHCRRLGIDLDYT